jgi:hypothetical protein
MNAPTAERTEQVPAPARSPRAGLALTSWAFVVAIALLGVAVLAGQASLVAVRGQGTSWIAAAADAMDGLQPETWVGICGVVLALLGLWLVWQAVRPRPRTTRRILAASGIHLRSRAIARWVDATARDVPGVLDTSTTVTRRAVRVTVRSTGSPDVLTDVHAEVTRQLSALERPPRLTVRASEGQRS